MASSIQAELMGDAVVTYTVSSSRQLLNISKTKLNYFRNYTIDCLFLHLSYHLPHKISELMIIEATITENFVIRNQFVQLLPFEIQISPHSKEINPTILLLLKPAVVVLSPRHTHPQLHLFVILIELEIRAIRLQS